MKKYLFLLITLFSIAFSVKTNAQVIEQFYLYPNPTASNIHVTIETNVFSRLRLNLYSLTGENVLTAFNDSIFWPGVYELTYDISFLDNGVYILVLTSNTGESQTIKVMKSGPLSIHQVAQSTPQVFPNPARNVVQIPPGVTEVRILDLSGKIILSPAVTSSTIDVSTVKNGRYIIQFVGRPVKTQFIQIQH